MKTIASLFATIGVLTVWEIEGGVCNEAECKRCFSKGLTRSNIPDRCKNGICSKHNSSLSRKHNIIVDWTQREFWQNPVAHELNFTQAKLFLEMATQCCLNDELNQSSPLSVHYRYPVVTRLKRYQKENRFVYGFYTPTSYLVMRTENYDILTVVRESFKQLWPTVCVCVTLTLISRIVIWLLDRRKNSIEFPKTFHKGVLEGAWWATVTMTTVGYGDKSPKSFPARIYAAAWMIIDMIILSTFTAEVSSGLAKKGIITHETTIGRSIGVPKGSGHFFRKKFNEATIKEFDPVQKLEEHLKRGDASNRIVLYSCKARDFTESNKQIVRVLDEDKLGTCVRKKMKIFSKYAGPEEEEEDEFDVSEETKCDFEKSSHSKLKEFQLFDMKAIIIYTSASFVVVTFAVGTVFDLIRYRKQKDLIKADVEACRGRKRNAVEERMERRA